MHHLTELSFVDAFRCVPPIHYLKNWMTECCSCLVHVASRAASFTLLLRRRVAILHRTATCRLFCNHQYHWCQLRTIELCFDFLSHFECFHLTLPRILKILYEFFDNDSLRIETCSNAECILLNWVAFDWSACIVTVRSSCLSVRLSSYISTAFTGRIFLKFEKNLSRKSKFG